jgi:tetratricopeptide (TPR) repeat protein
MPPQWTPSLKQKSANKLFSSSIAGLMTLLLLSFGAFIAYHIVSDTEVWSNVEVWFKQQVALYKSEEAIIKNQAETEVIDSKTVVTKNTEIRKAEEAYLKPHTGIVASDINKPIDINTQAQNPPLVAKKNFSKNEQAIEEDTTSPATINLKDLNKSPVKISDEKLAVSKQEKLLGPEEGHNTKDKSSSSVEINRLILLAEYQFENKKLSTPSGDNALETYQKILAKYPNNEQARNGIKKVHEKYLSWAGFYHQRNEFKRAKLFYNKALDIDPSNNLAKTNLQNIAQEEAASKAKRTTKPNALKLQETKSPESIQDLLDNADQKMQQIEIDIDTNNRRYKIYKETQEAYQNVLRSQPQNEQAIQGLFVIKNYYADWAKLQTQSKNYNIALFLYGQALSIDPGDAQITQRIEQIRELKKAQ